MLSPDTIYSMETKSKAVHWVFCFIKVINSWDLKLLTRVLSSQEALGSGLFEMNSLLVTPIALIFSEVYRTHVQVIGRLEFILCPYFTCSSIFCKRSLETMAKPNVGHLSYFGLWAALPISSANYTSIIVLKPINHLPVFDTIKENQKRL